MKTQAPHALLLSTIAAISFSTPADLANAQHVKWLATHGQIPADEITKVIAALENKMSEVSDSGDDTYVDQTYAELAAARTGAQAQLDMYRTLLDSDKIDAAGNLHNAPTARGRTESLDPAIVDRAHHTDAGRPNGRDAAIA